MQQYTLKVVHIERPVPDVVTISFKQPGLKKIKYKAGQYLTLILRINGRKFIRPYSFSSAPVVDPYLDVTVKRIPGGVVSNYLYDHVNVGDSIEVMEPLGDFLYDPEITAGEQHLMLWGAGSGITPLMSILKTALTRATNNKVSLFYCNRNPEHTIFKTELDALCNQYGNRFMLWNFYTGIPEDVYLNYQVAGRINEEKILTIVADTAELVQSQHYICGPQGLKDTIKSVLQKFAVPTANVFSEEFEVLIDPEQFDDIQTQTVTIEQNGNVLAVEVTKGKSILDAGLDAGLDLSYSCQTGTCTLCKAKLINGKVKLIGVDALPEEVEIDECLMCCSYPYTNDIKLIVN